MSPTRAASSRKRPPTRGPFKGVRTTRDPYDDSTDLLYDLVNCYIPDLPGLSGAYARPGFVLANGGEPVYTSATPFRGQAVYAHQMLDGSVINFIVLGGRLFRVDSTLTTFTNVSPVGITIDGSISTRVTLVSSIGQLVISDGVNRPWVAANLTSTPITGTYIDYDGDGVEWSSKPPILWKGGILFPIIQVGGVARGTDVAWTEPGSVTVGLEQPDFNNTWTLSTSNSGIIYALAGTNTAFYYFRALSIGSATGILGPDLASSATEDSISFNVGAQAAQTIQQFGGSFYFCDAIGRPWRYTPGLPPVPIWEQLREIVAASTVASQATTAITATAAIEPTLNLWLVAIWSPNPSQQAQPTQMFAFDAQSGTYLGRWIIGRGIAIDCIGTLQDAAGRVALVVLGSALAEPTPTSREAPVANGYMWIMNSLASVPAFLTTEDGDFITTEGGTPLTVEGEFAVWLDDGELPQIKAVTGRIGFAPDINMFVDTATIITGADAPVRISVDTSAQQTTVEGIPQPFNSHDGTFRLVTGCEAFGRGPSFTVEPLRADEQWSLQSISAVMIETLAGPDDA